MFNDLITIAPTSGSGSVGYIGINDRMFYAPSVGVTAYADDLQVVRVTAGGTAGSGATHGVLSIFHSGNTEVAALDFDLQGAGKSAYLNISDILRTLSPMAVPSARWSTARTSATLAVRIYNNSEVLIGTASERLYVVGGLKTSRQREWLLPDTWWVAADEQDPAAAAAFQLLSFRAMYNYWLDAPMGSGDVESLTGDTAWFGRTVTYRPLDYQDTSRDGAVIGITSTGDGETGEESCLMRTMRQAEGGVGTCDAVMLRWWSPIVGGWKSCCVEVTGRRGEVSQRRDYWQDFERAADREGLMYIRARIPNATYRDWLYYSDIYLSPRVEMCQYSWRTLSSLDRRLQAVRVIVGGSVSEWALNDKKDMELTITEEEVSQW